MFDNLQQQYFFKTFPQTHFPWKGLLKIGDEAHLETLLKDSNEDDIKVNQKISYTECRLSH